MEKVKCKVCVPGVVKVHRCKYTRNQCLCAHKCQGQEDDVGGQSECNTAEAHEDKDNIQGGYRASQVARKI